MGTTGSSGIGGTTGTSGTRGTGYDDTSSGIGGTTGSGYDNTSSGSGVTGTTVGSKTGGPIGQRDFNDTNTRDVNTGTSGTGTTKKPSLIDRLNPMKDTDGDGKKGLMD